MSETPRMSYVKVGVFTVIGLLLIGASTVYVNHKPQWWRRCQVVHINVDDATGLKSKSPIRSLGIEIGYLQSVELTETYVRLGICITAPVEVLPATRAYIRSEGFLGDKFVELKPVRYIGGETRTAWYDGLLIESAYAEEAVPISVGAPSSNASPAASPSTAPSAAKGTADPVAPVTATGATHRVKNEREIPMGGGNQDVQKLVGRVDELVGEMKGLASNLRSAVNPDELKRTLHELNRAIENASKTLSPQGGLNQTAQRTLSKLEDAVEQLRDQMTRVNQGQGSVGMLLNDPTYAEEFKEALKNLNKLLGRVGSIRLVVDIGGERIRGYQDSRSWFRVWVWSRPTRFYLLGVSLDPRGARSVSKTTTVAGGLSTVSSTTRIEQTSILLTGMVGWLFWDRMTAAIGALHGDGAVSLGYRFGPAGNEINYQLLVDLYSRGGENGVDARTNILVRPWAPVFVRGGLESAKRVNGEIPWALAAGVYFDDEDLKLLFAALR